MAESNAGRPTAYKEEYCEQAEKLCSLGATDEEVADFFKVSTRTIHRWKLEHEEFCHSISAGKKPADDRIERSLYQKASGFYYTEQQAIKIKVDAHKEQVEIVDVERYQPASDTAAIFWLKNRRKDDWRDKVDHEHTGKDGAELPPVRVTIVDPAAGD